MGGTLYFERAAEHKLIELPYVGSKVLIVVDSANRPTGVWRGKLIEVGKHNIDTTNLSCACRAIILDSAIDLSMGQIQGQEPTVNYTVFSGTTVIDEMLRRREENRKEIESLKRRLQITSETYEASLRAVANPPILERLTNLVERIERFLLKS